MFGKVRTERVTPHGPLGETRVPFESDQYKHKLFTFQNLKAKVPQKWTQMSSVKHISWSFLFPVGLCVRVSLCFSPFLCLSLPACLFSSLVCVSPLFLTLSVLFKFWFPLSLCPCLLLPLPSSGTALTWPTLNPLPVSHAAASTEHSHSSR